MKRSKADYSYEPQTKEQILRMALGHVTKSLKGSGLELSINKTAETPTTFTISREEDHQSTTPAP